MHSFSVQMSLQDVRNNDLILSWRLPHSPFYIFPAQIFWYIYLVIRSSLLLILLIFSLCILFITQKLPALCHTLNNSSKNSETCFKKFRDFCQKRTHASHINSILFFTHNIKILKVIFFQEIFSWADGKRMDLYYHILSDVVKKFQRNKQDILLSFFSPNVGIFFFSLMICYKKLAFRK